jgi:beta-galactosidase/beta-glucuronidase
MPRQFIESIGIDAKADGDFKMQVNLRGLKQDYDLIATIAGAGEKPTISGLRVHAGDSMAIIHTGVSHVKPWTTETPNLYSVEVTLQDINGKKIYSLNEKCGFRTIEIRRGIGVFINGTQVKFKGVNRHCFWPETGRTLSNDEQVTDAMLLKEMNMNAVRCSHYPPDKYFLQLCDSLGIYVLDELAGWQKYYSTKAGEPLVKEMVLRDLNHPSIIFWDNGNEGGTNKELDDDFDKWDFQRRPVIHPHHRPGNDFNGIDCNHYEDYYSTQKILNDSLIYMPTEFLHSQDDGGGGAGMEDFWELHWHSQRSAGGFIWAMIDESVMRTDMNNVLDGNGLNANDGILGPHREKEGSFYALRKIFSPIRLDLPDRIPPAFIGEIPIENRYHFLNTNQCSFYWALVNFSQPFDRFDGYVVKQKGEIKSPILRRVAKGYSGFHCRII